MLDYLLQYGLFLAEVTTVVIGARRGDPLSLQGHPSCPRIYGRAPGGEEPQPPCRPSRAKQPSTGTTRRHYCFAPVAKIGLNIA